jgi:hypothetical protein
MPDRPRPRPRLQNDRDRYLRQFGNTWQAWPYLQGQRFYLGSFPTEIEARRAIRSWQAGTLKPRPKGIRVQRKRQGVLYHVDVVIPSSGIRVQATLTQLSDAIDLVEQVLTPLGAVADAYRKRG